MVTIARNNEPIKSQFECDTFVWSTTRTKDEDERVIYEDDWVRETDPTIEWK